MFYNHRMEEPNVQETSLGALASESEGSESLLGRIFSAQPNKNIVLVCAIAFLFTIAYLDWLTSPEIHLPLLYILPGTAVTWFVSRRAGYCVSIVSAFVQLGAEVVRTDVYTHPSRAYWNTGSRIIFFILLVTLISAMKQMSTHLSVMVSERTDALRRLASQLSDAEDSERRHLANDIHDSLSQTLTLLKLSLSAALAEQGQEPGARQRIAGALATVNELIQKTRTLMFDLYPAMLEHLGLCQTLRHYGEEFARQTGIEVTVNEEGFAQTPSRTMANYLFRSAMELVNNAAKHSGAKEIVISLHWTTHTLRVIVDDDGGGFDPLQSFTPDKSKGLGLAAIHERLRSLGGSVRIESGPGQGTRVVLEAPLAAREAA
jgi:signal transduction histidine kinase